MFELCSVRATTYFWFKNKSVICENKIGAFLRVIVQFLMLYCRRLINVTFNFDRLEKNLYLRTKRQHNNLRTKETPTLKSQYQE